MSEESGQTGPRQVLSIENIWIPMRDGVKLAARLWLPQDTDQNPVPAVIEYIPYRKRDFTRLRDEEIHPYLASHGYACLRVDIRGAGDSEGLPQDEYVRQEQDDGVDVIAWIAQQSWCTGKVGMFGISWGGFSSLQVAARRPPALKAIITLCSTDDRYTDSDHWMGGCIEETFFTWGAYATLIGARPPDPAIVGNRWREMWAQRLDSLAFYVGDWLVHQHQDYFWKHASISEDYGQIDCAVYAVGGWADHFNSTVARMLANLQCPRKGLIGPWNHSNPHRPGLGPPIDWLSEMVRWWDHWLKDRDTGIMQEPMYRVWMQHDATIRGMREVPGHWVAEETWPSSRITALRYHLTGDSLDLHGGADTARTLNPLQTVGVTAPARYYRDAGLDIGLPGDQRIDDARSLTFDSAPLLQDVEILGAVTVTLELAVDKPVAFLAVRLNEVQPGGISKRISFSVLNLTHRNGHEFPEPVESGKRIRVRVVLNDCAHRFRAGNRIRLSISSTYWPAFWPSPEPVTLTLYTAGAQIELPVRPTRSADSQLRSLGVGFVPTHSGVEVLVPATPESKIYEWDVGLEKLVIRSQGDKGRYRLKATDTEMAGAWEEVTEILEHDPTSATIKIWMSESYSRGDWDVRIRVALQLSLSRDNFLISGEIKCYEGGVESFSKGWHRTIARRLL